MLQSYKSEKSRITLFPNRINDLRQCYNVIGKNKYEIETRKVFCGKFLTLHDNKKIEGMPYIFFSLKQYIVSHFFLLSAFVYAVLRLLSFFPDFITYN
jgi:hypothetical protein